MKKRNFFLGLIAVLLVSVFAIFSSGWNAFAEASIGTVTISGSVSLVGGNLQGNDFTYILRNSDGQELARTKNTSDGRIVFENVPYTASEIKNEKYLTYTIEQVEGSDDAIRYDKNTAYVAVELTGSEVETINYAKPNAITKEYLDYEDTVFHASDDELVGEVYTVFDSGAKTLTFFRSEEEINEWTHYYDEDGIELPGQAGSAYSRTFKKFDEDADEAPSLYYGSEAEKVIFKDAVKPKTLWFSNFKKCKYYDLRKLDTSRMTSMYNMFAYNESLESIDVSSFDFSNVTTVSGMFDNAIELKTIILGDWDTSNIEYTSYLFNKTKLDYFDYKNFDSSSLKNAFEMFRDTKIQNLDVSDWKVNGYYDDDNERKMNFETIEFAVNTSPEYINIGRWVGVSAESSLNIRDNLKAFTLCNTYGRIQSGWAHLFGSDASYIGLNTGEHIERYVDSDQELCDTYIREGIATMEFVNYKKNRLEVSKVDENGNPLRGAEMALLENGGLLDTWVSDGSAKVFSDLENGKSYQIIELNAPDGYKLAEPVNVTVEDGVVKVDGEAKNSVLIQDVANKIEVEKKWENDSELVRPDSIRAQLVSANDESVVLDEVELTEDSGWKSELVLANYKDDYGFDIPLKVIEAGDLAQYRASYDVEDGKTTITNSYAGSLMSYSFIKKWEGDDASSRPQSIVVKIYNKDDMDEPVATMELTSENATEDDADIWEAEFEGLPVSDDQGNAIEYAIAEDEVDGYTASYAYSEDYSVEGDFVDMFEFSCQFETGGGGWYGVLVKLTDDDELSSAMLGGTNGTIYRFPVDEKYELFIEENASCTGRSIYADRSTANIPNLSQTITRATLETQEGSYTEKSLENGAMISEKGRKERFIFEPKSHDGSTDDISGEAFPGANVITNKKITEPEESEEPSENVNTGDTDTRVFFVSAAVFGSIAAGYWLYNKRFAR